MGLDFLVEQQPEHGVVVFEPGEHRTTFQNRDVLLARYPLVSRLLSYVDDSAWDVGELPALREQLVAFCDRAMLDHHLTGKLRRLVGLVDHAVRVQRHLVAEAD
ncbi:MAG: hypothetical protein ACI8PZ_004784 [Myxococcota bacterium]|jgi:hypothetical protein